MSAAASGAVTRADVLRAAQRLEGVAWRTPVLRSDLLDARVGAEVLVKCEGLQRTGAFKLRGAWNAVASLGDEELTAGVITCSSGNHGRALAYAAARRSVRCVVVLPSDAPAGKRAAIAAEGAELVVCDPAREDRMEVAEREAQRRGMRLVAPFDDVSVIAGQGTVALELLEQAGTLDVLMTPIGGGGLLSGCAVACDGHDVEIVGAEPAALPKCSRSLAAGRRVSVEPQYTMADALRARVPGRLTFPLLLERGVRAVTVSETELAAAMRFAAEQLGVVAEPSGAAALAAVLAGRMPADGRRIGVVLSGSNVDLSDLSTLTSGAP